MKISELDKKVDIMIRMDNEGPIENLDATYIPCIENIWAKKTRLLGKESVKLGADHNIVQVNFIIRSRNDISEDMFIRHDNVIYNIVGYEELKGDRNYMLIATVKKQVIS